MRGLNGIVSALLVVGARKTIVWTKQRAVKLDTVVALPRTLSVVRDTIDGNSEVSLVIFSEMGGYSVRRNKRYRP